MMRQLILGLVCSVFLWAPLEAITYRGCQDDESRGNNSSNSNKLRQLEEGDMNYDARGASSAIRYYASPAEFYFSDRTSGLLFHLRLLYNRDVKMMDFIRIAPLWEKAVVFGLPSLLTMIIFSQFIF